MHKTDAALAKFLASFWTIVKFILLRPEVIMWDLHIKVVVMNMGYY